MKLTVLLISGLGALALVGCSSGNNQPGAAAQSATPDQRSVTTQSVGTVQATPDTVTVIFGVQSTGASARAALEANNQKAAAVISTLKSRGVAARDLQTDGLSLQPNYGKANEITGYQVSENVTAKLRTLSTAGVVIDSTTTAAGDAARLQQVSFSIADDAALLDQARAAAVVTAREQAGQMAKAGELKLGAVRTITEVPQGQQSFAFDIKAPNAAASVPLQPGTLKLSVALTVTFDLG